MGFEITYPVWIHVIPLSRLAPFIICSVQSSDYLYYVCNKKTKCFCFFFFSLSSFLSKNTWAFFAVSFICDYIESLIFSLWDLIDSWEIYILIEQRKVWNFVTYLGLKYWTVRINYYYYFVVCSWKIELI